MPSRFCDFAPKTKAGVGIVDPAAAPAPPPPPPPPRAAKVARQLLQCFLVKVSEIVYCLYAFQR